MSSGSQAPRQRSCGSPTRASLPIADEASKLRVAILGAGSIGCFVGGCWQKTGLAVQFIGREAIGSDIARHGLSLSDHDGWHERIAPGDIDFSTDPAGIGNADIIVLCVKSGATGAAARDIASYGREGASVLSLQNGISNMEVMGRTLGDRFQLIRGMVPYNVAYLGDGHFHKGVAGDLFAQDLAPTRALAGAIGRSPAALKLSGDMAGLAWGKLLINLNNAVNALSGESLAAQLRQRDYRRVFAAAMSEGLRLLGAARIRPAKVGKVGPGLLPWVIRSPDWLFNSVFMKAFRIDERARSSMADDLVAGRSTEVDHINGEIVQLATRLGLDAPVNRKIVELVHLAEAGAPSRSSAVLRQLVLGR